MLALVMKPAKLRPNSGMIVVCNADISIPVWRWHRMKKLGPRPIHPKRNM
jgi:hypothetical protein